MQNPIKVIDQSTLQELIKFIQNVIVLMVVLLTVSRTYFILNCFVFITRKKIYKEPRIKLFKKINKTILSHITFYLEDDDHKAVDLNGETISFTCQLIKI